MSTPAKPAPALGTAAWRAATGLTLVGVEATIVWRFGWSAALPAYLYLAAALTVASVIDARTLKIPAVLLLPSYPAGVALLAAAASADRQWWPLARAAIAMAAVAGFYLAVALGAGGQRFGLADVELGGLIGLLLGWVGWTAVSTGVLAGWVTALVGVLVWRQGRSRAHGPAVWPAAPCLWVGALLALLVAR